MKKLKASIRWGWGGKKAETMRKRTLDENGKEVLRQISERKEKEMLFRRTMLEEGRILK